MSMIEAYVKNIPEFSLAILEEFSEDWATMPNTEIKEAAFVALINEKLKRYEQEY